MFIKTLNKTLIQMLHRATERYIERQREVVKASIFGDFIINEGSHLSESNRRPFDYESNALPTELRWQKPFKF